MSFQCSARFMQSREIYPQNLAVSLAPSEAVYRQRLRRLEEARLDGRAFVRSLQ